MRVRKEASEREVELESELGGIRGLLREAERRGIDGVVGLVLDLVNMHERIRE